MYSLFVLEKGKIKSIPLIEESKMYILCRKDYWLNNKEMRMDASFSFIALNSPYVSKKHGALRFVGENWVYIDLGSTNGSYINGRDVSISEEYPLYEGDRIYIKGRGITGKEEDVMIVCVSDYHEYPWKTVDISKIRSISLGSQRDYNDVVLASRWVSARHAEIIKDRCNGISIKDLESKNGVYINGKRIDNEKVLNDKDVIRFGDKHVIVDGKNLYVEEDMIQDNYDVSDKKILLEAHIKTKKVKDKKGGGLKELLKDVSIIIKEGSLVALLGTSGAGKTTLMNCLNGMDTTGLEGKIKYKGHDLIKDFKRYKYQIGSVPQENVFHEDRIVEEELLNAAELKLPRTTSYKKIVESVNWTIKKLKLENVRNNRISLCSGGEKKRVNIAIDLVANRNLLCLDEPDAGLDPEMKRELFEILQDLAHNENKSILVIIHDVSELELFDQIIMMAKKDNIGRLAFSGSPEEAERRFGTSVKNIYGLLTEDPEKYIVQ